MAETSDPPKRSGPERQPLARGLPSVEEARQQRGKRRMMPPKFWAWAALFIGAGIIIWWKVEEGQIQRMRNELLGRQRAVKAKLGPRWTPLRDKMERWTQECAAEKFKEVRGEGLVKSWDFRKMNGIYLRLAQDAARSTESIREAAVKSLHDGFTACLMHVPNPSPLRGPRCATTQDCAEGHWCNEFNHCAKYSQPYNLRLAYKTMYVMTDDWVKEIQAITKKLTLRGAVATFDVANKYDLPVAAQLLVKAKYFMVIVDEPADKADADANELPPAGDGGVDAGASDDRNIPTAPHKARVCIWRLKDDKNKEDKKMLAILRDAAGTFVGPSGSSMSPSTRIARQRQANSCALALAVREEISQ